jgi:hypothetical protein
MSHKARTKVRCEAISHHHRSATRTAYLSTTVVTAAASSCHVQIRTQKPPITHFAPHRQISAAIEKFLAGLPHAPLPTTGLGGFSGSARRDLDSLRGAKSRNEVSAFENRSVSGHDLLTANLDFSAGKNGLGLLKPVFRNGRQVPGNQRGIQVRTGGADGGHILTRRPRHRDRRDSVRGYPRRKC